MPIQAGARGAPPGCGVPGDRVRRRRGTFASPDPSAQNPVVSGTTRDSAGTALASCEVHLFRTVDDVEVGQTTSNGSGAFAFYPTSSGPFYVVAYKAGGTDVTGASVNTLIAAP